MLLESSSRVMIECTMKRKIFFFVGLLLLIAAIVGGISLIGGKSSKQGELRVDSQPVASIFLDNKHIGRTPYKDKVAVGEYTIKLVPETTVGTPASWQGKIAVGANLLTYVNSVLSDSELTSAVDVLWLEKISSKTSEVSITTNPDGATMLIDNVTKGVTPLTVSDLAPGDHTLTVNSPGFVSRTLKTKTTAGYRLIASIKLALSGEPIPTPTKEATPSSTLTGKTTPTKTATSSGTLQDPSKPFAVIKDTPTGFLRVRMEPSTSATESARVNPGEKYHIYDETSGWYQIIYSGTSKGWISGQYAEKVE